MNTNFANTNGSMLGAGIEISAASETATALAIRILGTFAGGLTLTAFLAGLLGR